jgi:rare lipoprotein A (peptidoglycan hydrolase)
MTPRRVPHCLDKALAAAALLPLSACVHAHTAAELATPNTSTTAANTSTTTTISGTVSGDRKEPDLPRAEPDATPAEVVTSTVPEPTVAVQEAAPAAVVQAGEASWYDAAPGTTASRDYPFGTVLNVCHADRCAKAVVDDYGPDAWTGRSLDLSRDVFSELADPSAGVIDVTWTVEW